MTLAPSIVPQAHADPQPVDSRELRNLETILEIASLRQAHPGHVAHAASNVRYERPDTSHAAPMAAMFPEVQALCLTMDRDAVIPPLGHLSERLDDGNVLHAFFHPDRTGQLVMHWTVEVAA